MGSYSGSEEDQYFDTRDDVSSSVSDLGSDCLENCETTGLFNSEFWLKKPESINERREKFLQWMGFHLDSRVTETDEMDDLCHHGCMEEGNDRIRDDEEAVLANFDSEPTLFNRSCESDDTAELVEDGAIEDILRLKIKDLDTGAEFIMDEVDDDGTITKLRKVGSDGSNSVHDFQKSISSSQLVQKLMRKDTNTKGPNKVDSKKKQKNYWLHRFSHMTHIADQTKSFVKPNAITSKAESATRRVQLHVHVSKKNFKELSSLYRGQEFPAHEGSILTMKFSPDGQYLASSGVDGIVRIWKVLQDNIVDKFNAQDMDPSCLYFSLSNYLSKLSPLSVTKEKSGSDRSARISPSSPCVALPPKGFHLSEKPLHEFVGHKGEVLALSWSKNGHILSSSVDKTARLWRVGHDDCQGVYSHNNYVTCIDFNPVDDNHFISGSIDGKLRVWEVQGGRVIDWTDVREIVTAVCYRPDGKGGIIGSMDGNCQYFEIIDDHLQLGLQISLKRKKKLPGKRIVGFQYCPSDMSRIVITSADSKVRILYGPNKVYKLKGSRTPESQVPASFTSDGEHIVSIGKDSNIRVWNYPLQEKKSSQPKIAWSCESFLSHDASIAIPWCGLKNKLGALPGNILGNHHFDEKLLLQKLPVSFPDCVVTSLGLFLDSLYKGSATWPEEKLPRSNPKVAAGATEKQTLVSRSEYKFLKNAWVNAMNAPHSWGLVVVTAGWDGCIRTFLNYGLPIRL